eukprot:TRINITY_DN11134_c0_g1_i1.p1 TRINITY_DN11134_c0_g1~~TRINITY_DN11134_c0_g1_i1.p1  ORF type:complete len:892 (-),score=240.99 TRINITY_DN11134_c0_g1_i1:1222-3897(-)
MDVIRTARLQEDRMFHDILLSFCGAPGEDTAIIAPQNVTLEGIEITRAFVETHVIVINPRNSNQFLSLNGVHGLINSAHDAINVISGPPELFDPLTDLKALFGAHELLFEEYDPDARGPETIVALREGELDLKLAIHDSDGVFVTEHEAIVPLILVSEPIKYPGCEWSYANKLPPVPAAKPPPSTSGGFRMGPISVMLPSALRSNPTPSPQTPPSSSQIPSSTTAGYFGPINNKVGNIKDWINFFGTTQPPEKPPLFPDSPIPPHVPSSLSTSMPVPSTQGGLSGFHNSPSYDSLMSLNPEAQDDQGISSGQGTPPNASAAALNAAAAAAGGAGAQKRPGFFTKLKSPKANDVTKMLKSFVAQFMAHPPATIEEQGALVRDFIADMEARLAEHPLWKIDLRDYPDEAEAVREGLEKFVMSKLYAVVFAPALLGAARERERGAAPASGSGDSAVPEVPTTEDEGVERQITLHQFITPAHLDIQPHRINEAKIALARSELRKINSYKTPRDKMVCVFNCCKVVYNLLSSPSSTGDGQPATAAGADEFLPLLIYVVLRANPPMLCSNMDYISHFRHSSKLITETGYYLTQLVSVIAFVNNIQPQSLTIDPLEFAELKAKAEAEMKATGPPPSMADLLSGLVLGSPMDSPTVSPLPATKGIASQDFVSADSTLPLSSTSSLSSSPVLGSSSVPPDFFRANNVHSAPSSPARGTRHFNPDLHRYYFAQQDTTPSPVSPPSPSIQSTPVSLSTLPSDVRRQHPFYDVGVESIPIGQVSTLLEEYKRLVRDNYLLKLRLSSSPSPSPNAPRNRPSHATQIQTAPIQPASSAIMQGATTITPVSPISLANTPPSSTSSSLTSSGSYSSSSGADAGSDYLTRTNLFQHQHHYYCCNYRYW